MARSDVVIFGTKCEADDEIGAKFSWLTRTGAGVKFGSRPTASYELHQIRALEEIERRAIGALRLLAWSVPGRDIPGEPFEATKRWSQILVRRLGGGESDWRSIGTANEIYHVVDRSLRS